MSKDLDQSTEQTSTETLADAAPETAAADQAPAPIPDQDEPTTPAE